MTDSNWSTLVFNAVFLPPEVVEAFAELFGDATVMPVTFRGQPADWGADHNNGFPIYAEDGWYSLWGMRPSRDVCSIALGLRRRDLEQNANRELACNGDRVVKGDWRVHHVYECGICSLTVKRRAECFTNLANLVLVSKWFHERAHRFIHADGPGAQWFRWIVTKLYPRAAGALGPTPAQPAGSPGIDSVNIAMSCPEALCKLRELRELEPAGTDIATRRWNEARAGKPIAHTAVAKPAPRPPLAAINQNEPLKMGKAEPSEIVQHLKHLGYLARQNRQDAALYLNLGGAQSELNRVDCRGLVLIHPQRGLIFGTSREEMMEFRQLVMQQESITEWTRRPGVPGPTADQRVEVRFDARPDGQGEMTCRTTDGLIRIDGYAERLSLRNDLGTWAQVEKFLGRLDGFCSQRD